MNARVPPYYDSISDSDGKVSKIWLNYFQSLGSGGTGGGLANPTAQIGLTPVNGIAATGIRSDGAPALSQAITPTWSALHTFSVSPVVSPLAGSGDRLVTATPVGALGNAATIAGNYTWSGDHIFSHLVSFPAYGSDAFLFLGTGGQLETNSYTGTGDVVLSSFPTLTGLITAQDATFSGTLTATLTGNADTATALQTARTINGVAFDGTADITITATADAGTLTGTTLASNVLASSLTSVGTLAALTVTATISGSVSGNAATVTTNANLTGPITSVGNATSVASQTGTGSTFAMSAGPTFTGTLNAATITASGAVTGSNLSGTNTGDQTSVSGNAGTATALQTPRAINGVNFDGTANITVAAAASTLTGTTLASNVLASSLTSVGTLAALTVTATIAGSINGNAATVTTNANLTGPIASTGNATSITSQTGTGSTFVMSADPTLTGTLTGAIANFSGALSVSYNSAIATIGNGVGAPSLILNGAAGSLRGLVFNTNGVNRWEVYANATAEAGANVGTNFRLTAFDDTGAAIDNPIAINRVAGGAMTLSRPITISTTLTQTGVATFTAQPIFNSATASTAAAFDASKGLISVTITGSGNSVYSASPTLTGTIAAANQTLSGTLGVTGDAQFSSAIIVNNGGSPTAGAIYSDAVNGLSIQGITGSTHDISLKTAGGAVILSNTPGSQAIAIPGAITASGILSIGNTTDSTSIATGAMHTTGGVGMSKALWVGGKTNLASSSATTAGGALAVNFGSSSVTGIYFGSGAPTISAPKGALYLRTDGSTTNDRAYINTNGTTTWTALTTVA